MIKIGARTFVPLKVAANHVGYSVDWIYKCSARYAFPARVAYNGRIGFWLHQLDRWKKKRVQQVRAA